MIDERKYEAEMAFFRMKIEEMPDRTGERIRDLIKSSPFGDIKNDPNVVEEMARYFESVYSITQNVGVIITKHEYVPWWAGVRRSEDFDPYYWERFKRYLREVKKFTPKVIAALDGDTDEILDHSGNPRLDEPWGKRGMVLGHVQSGKTSNYSALICKAADAGYKVIILLSGTSNLLRRQTQQRIDEAFIGRQATFGRNQAGGRIGAGNYFPAGQSSRHPFYGTTIVGDFSRQVAQSYGVSIEGANEPIIFVIKKNVNVLSNLHSWLLGLYPHGQISHPLLLIDDEADNASINTHSDPDMVTKVNEKIRSLLGLFERSSYVGYTATPFANIFIDPDSEQDMLSHDLFPSDFIKSLEPPTNYVGPNQVFPDDESDESPEIVRNIDDHTEIIPFKHKKDLSVQSLPQSLEKAVRLFVLCRAIMVSEGMEGKHSTMMVNVSIYNAVQEQVKGLVHECLDRLKGAIRLHAGKWRETEENDFMSALKRDFESEYESEKHSWRKIRSHLHVAASDIVVKAVNMTGDILDYESNRNNGLHVIAVGGFALSRGLTLEGLCISYLIRNARAYDTLMQMGRWFGYRDGYEDICRVFMPERSAYFYEFVASAANELREEIVTMNELKKTPMDFGLKVRHHSASILQITARNKMRGAEVVEIAGDLNANHVKANVLFADKEKNIENLERINSLVENLGVPGEPITEKHEAHLLWRGVSCKKILDFMSEIKLPDINKGLTLIEGSWTLAQKFILEREDEFSKWDVCLPSNPTGGRFGESKNMEIAGRTIRLRERNTGRLMDGGFYRIASRGVSDRLDAEIGMSKESLGRVKGERQDRSLNEQREFPLLLLHIIDSKDKDSGEKFFGDTPAASYSICFPVSKKAPVREQYATNKVYQNQLLDYEEDGYDNGEDNDEQ